jgi:hypothetical protein
MAIGSGLGASLGVAAESTYGTFVTPTRFLEFTKEGLRETKTTSQSGGVAAGRFAQLSNRRVVTTRAAQGAVDLEVMTRGFGLLIAHILGSSATPVQQAATIAYLQSHTLGDNRGKSLTLQVGRPDTTGTVQDYTYLGCKVMSAEFACETDGQLTLTVEVDGREASETATFATPSYATNGLPFHFGQMAVKIGAYGAEAAASGVKKWSIKFERGQDTSRFYAGGAGRKDEPIMNDWVKVTGSIEADFVSKADFADRFASDAAASLVVEFVGATIASTYKDTIRFKTPAIFIDGEPTVVEGPDVLKASWNYTAQFDGTNSLLAIDYLSADTTL